MNAVSSPKKPIHAITESEFLRLYKDVACISALYVTETGSEVLIGDLRDRATDWAADIKRVLDKWGTQPAKPPKHSAGKRLAVTMTREFVAALAEGLSVPEYHAQLERQSDPRNLALDMARASKYVEILGMRYRVVPDIKEEPAPAQGVIPQRALLAPAI